jgi:hypothetical protein
VVRNSPANPRRVILFQEMIMGTYQVTIKVETEQTYLVEGEDALEAEQSAIERFEDEDGDVEDRSTCTKLTTIWISNDDLSEADDEEMDWEDEEDEVDEAA